MLVLFLYEVVLQSRGGIVQTSQSNHALYDFLSYVCPCPLRDIGWTHNIIAPIYNIGAVMLDYDSNIDFSIALLWTACGEFNIKLKRFRIAAHLALLHSVL